MSRHTIEAGEPAAFEIVIGYDPPLDSFFAQVINREVRARIERAQEERERAYRDALTRGVEPDADRDEAEDEDYFTLWVGTTVGEVQTVEDLAEALAPYAVISPEMRETLRRDREREAHPPTRYQQLMRSLLRGSTKRRPEHDDQF
jgi:hypothetical protein